MELGGPAPPPRPARRRQRSRERSRFGAAAPPQPGFPEALRMFIPGWHGRHGQQLLRGEVNHLKSNLGTEPGLLSGRRGRHLKEKAALSPSPAGGISSLSPRLSGAARPQRGGSVPSREGSTELPGSGAAPRSPPPGGVHPQQFPNVQTEGVCSPLQLCWEVHPRPAAAWNVVLEINSAVRRHPIRCPRGCGCRTLAPPGHCGQRDGGGRAGCLAAPREGCRGGTQGSRSVSVRGSRGAVLRIRDPRSSAVHLGAEVGGERAGGRSPRAGRGLTSS